MFKGVFGEQKYSFRHIKNLSALSSGLDTMIEKLRIKRRPQLLQPVNLKGVVRDYHPLGTENEEQEVTVTPRIRVNDR